MPQIRAEQLEPAIRLEPDLASVLGGINDVLRRSLDLDRVVGDLDAMAAELSARGATVLTFTFPDPTAVITVAAARIRARVDRLQRPRPADGRRSAARSSSTSSATGSPIPTLWCDDRLHANGDGHARIAGAAAAAALGLEDGRRSWAAPLPDPPPRSAASRYAADAVWMARHLTPWMIRRLRGVSSGDGREPKRPELMPISDRTLPG